MRVSKSEEVKRLYRVGCVNKAIALASKFRFYFNEEEKRVLQIANECINHKKKSFYYSIGIDCENIINEALGIIDRYTFYT